MTKPKHPTQCRAAVVGAAGYWGSYYTKTYAENSRCDLYAIVDTAAERRGMFAETYGVPAQYDTVSELLRDGTPDICTISLPVSISHDVVLECAEAGVPVISCEKPIAENLAKADEMVEECRRLGSILSCGTAMWEYPLFPETIQWVQEGHLGEQSRVHIPGGLSPYVTGNGCVQLVAAMRLSGSEVAWVEGWTDPPEAAETDGDCNAYGRLGFCSGAVCDVPAGTDARPRAGCIGVSGSLGQVWIARQGQVFMGLAQNVGDDGNGHVFSDRIYPVFPEFANNRTKGMSGTFTRAVDTYVNLFAAHGRGDNGPADPTATAYSSGHDYRQALEIGIALKLSARNGHARIELPLTDRNQTLNPVPYRLLGGDVTGWDAIGLKPPKIRE